MNETEYFEELYTIQWYSINIFQKLILYKTILSKFLVTTWMKSRWCLWNKLNLWYISIVALSIVQQKQGVDQQFLSQEINGKGQKMKVATAMTDAGFSFARRKWRIKWNMWHCQLPVPVNSRDQRSVCLEDEGRCVLYYYWLCQWCKRQKVWIRMNWPRNRRKSTVIQVRNGNL